MYLDLSPSKVTVIEGSMYFCRPWRLGSVTKYLRDPLFFGLEHILAGVYARHTQAGM